MEIIAKMDMVAKDSVIAQTEKTQRPQPWLTIICQYHPHCNLLTKIHPS